MEHPPQASPVILTSTINDIRQAFFKVAPGIYRVHQTKDWADQTPVNNVEVRDGSYSVILIEVNNPRTLRAKDVLESNLKD